MIKFALHMGAAMGFSKLIWVLCFSTEPLGDLDRSLIALSLLGLVIFQVVSGVAALVKAKP